MKKVLLITFIAFQLYGGTKAKPCNKKGKCQKKGCLTVTKKL